MRFPMSDVREPLSRRARTAGALLLLALVASTLLGSTLLGPSPDVDAFTDVPTAGVPAGTKLTPSDRLKVTQPGAVIDSLDVTGFIYVQANDVTIKRTRVNGNTDYGIRVYPGVTGTVIEDVDVRCAPGHKRYGVVFGGYTARRVEVNGCREGFLTHDGPTVITDSFVDGKPVGDVTSPSTTAAPTTTTAAPTTTVAPTTTTAAPTTTTAAPTTTTAPPTTVTGTSGTPTAEWIVANAGLSNPAALRASGGLTITQDGAVVENVDVAGTISVKANNVTLRNCRVRGYSSVNVVRLYAGFSGLTIEHCVIEALASPTDPMAGPNGAIGGSSASRMTVRHTEIRGYADGIKAEPYSLYEYNHIHMSKPSGSSKHLDGIQGSGRSYWTVRGNVIDADVSRGGNAAVFAQAYNGSMNFHIYGIVIEANYLRGGNFTVFLEGGKTYDGSDPASWVHGYKLLNNRFTAGGQRYGYIKVANCAETTISGNALTQDGSLVTAC